MLPRTTVPQFREPPQAAWRHPLDPRDPDTAPRSRLTLDLLEQAVVDLDLACMRTRGTHLLILWWRLVRDGGVLVPAGPRAVPDDAWAIRLSVRRDVLHCRTSATFEPVSAPAVTAAADRRNLAGDGLHAVGVIESDQEVRTHAAVPLLAGVGTAELGQVIRLLADSVIAFHLEVLALMDDEPRDRGPRPWDGHRGDAT